MDQSPRMLSPTDYCEAWGVSDSRMKSLGLSYWNETFPSESYNRERNKARRERGMRHNHKRRKSPFSGIAGNKS